MLEESGLCFNLDNFLLCHVIQQDMDPNPNIIKVKICFNAERIWIMKVGGFRIVNENWRMEDWRWRIEDGGLEVEDGGLKVED